MTASSDAGSPRVAEETVSTPVDTAKQEVWNPVIRLSVPDGEFKRRLDALIAAVRAESAQERERLEANLAQLIKAEEGYRQNEQYTARQLSRVLSDGSASTWDEIIDAATKLCSLASPPAQEKTTFPDHIDRHGRGHFIAPHDPDPEAR